MSGIDSEYTEIKDKIRQELNQLGLGGDTKLPKPKDVATTLQYTINNLNDLICNSTSDMDEAPLAPIHELFRKNILTPATEEYFSVLYDYIALIKNVVLSDKPESQEDIHIWELYLNKMDFLHSFLDETLENIKRNSEKNIET